MEKLLCLVPPVLTLIIALKSKNIIAALFTGILSCSIVANGQNFLTPILGQYMTQAVGGNLDIFIMLFIFGGMMVVIKSGGGFYAFTRFAEARIRTARGAKFVTWLLALVLGDQAMSTIGVGSVMRPITDKYKVPREKLGFILSSTGPAMCAILPWTIFILFYSGMIQSVNPELNGVQEYMKLIPFNFYAFLSILAALLSALEILPDFGYMKKCEERARVTGELIRPGSQPIAGGMEDMGAPAGVKPDIVSFLLPFGVAIGSVILLYVQTGQIVLTTSFLLGLLAVIVYGVLKKYFRVRDVSGMLFEGGINMVPVIIILTMALTFGKAVTDIGFAEFIVEVSEGLINPKVLPALTFLVCGICAFATGSLTSGLTILAPICIVLAGSMGANLTLTLAACLGGAMFGDQTSPLSDMVVEPSMGAGVDVVDLAKAHFPVKAGVAAATCLIYLVMGFVL